MVFRGHKISDPKSHGRNWKEFGRHDRVSVMQTIEVPQRLNILGVGLSAINMSMALRQIDCWIREQAMQYVCIRDAHGIILSQSDSKLRRIHNEAGLVTPDGMPLVWLLKLAGHRYVGRVCGPDLMLALFEESREGRYKHFLYGGTQAVLTGLRGNLERWFPGVYVVGTYAPPFRSLTPEEDEMVGKLINDSGADIVWVGLGTPKQEFWMAKHRDRLHAPVMIGVGAAFDLHAGVKHRAPKFIQRSGLEWLYRLTTEPRRLWRRYLKTVPYFVFLLLCQILGLKRYSIDT